MGKREMGQGEKQKGKRGARQIKVRVRFPNLVVRTRDRYSTGTIARKN
jgi:hypothetical protein